MQFDDLSAQKCGEFQVAAALCMQVENEGVGAVLRAGIKWD